MGVPFFSGQRLTAADLNIATGQNAWTSYTPTWSGTGVSLSNGTIAGRYSKFGRAVTVTIDLQIGSTTAVGTGLWSFSLPIAAASTLAGQGWAGSIYAYSNAANNRAGVFIVNPAATTGYCDSDVANGWSGTVPQAWASGDGFSLNVTYEVAS